MTTNLRNLDVGAHISIYGSNFLTLRIYNIYPMINRFILFKATFSLIFPSPQFHNKI